MKHGLKRSLKFVFWGGVSTSFVDTLVVGPILLAYAALFGAGDIAFGILGAIPYFGNLAHLISAWLIEHNFSIRKTAFRTAFVSRFFLLIAALLAFYPQMPGALIILISALTLKYFIGCISGGLWLPWMKSLIPSKMMGRFFSFFFVFWLLEIMISYSCIASPFVPKTAHIYIDFASVPTVFQIADALRQNPTDPKLFMFKRLKALDANDDVLKSINAEMLDPKYLKRFDKFSRQWIDSNLLTFYNRYPDYHFIIHLNAVALYDSGHFEKIIPKNQLKALHFYDDSVGRSLWDQTFIKDYTIFAKRFPTYAHIGYYDFKKLPIDPSHVFLMDFRELASILSPVQKKKMAHIIGIDYEQAQNTFKKRPIVFFVDDPNLKSESAEKFIQKILKQYPDSQNYYWLYKNHPRIPHPSPNLSILQKYFKNVSVVPNKIPLESFLSIGFPIDYVAGYGSSIFYSFKKEQVLGYIRRIKGEYYEPLLLLMDILTPNLIFDDSISPQNQ